jgi:hypothetical protein
MRFISADRGSHGIGPSHCKSSVWRDTNLLKENVWFEGVQSAGLQTSQMCRDIFYYSRCSLKKKGPVTTWRESALHTLSVSWNCSNHRLMVCLLDCCFHIADGNVFTLEWLILSPSTTAHILPFAGGKLPFCFHQRHYRPGNHSVRKILCGSFEECNSFPDISKTLWFM